MLRSRMLSVAGVGCLGALLGTLGGVMIATYIAMGQFDSDLKQESARSGAALKTFEEEQEAVRKKSGKTRGTHRNARPGSGKRRHSRVKSGRCLDRFLPGESDRGRCASV